MCNASWELPSWSLIDYWCFCGSSTKNFPNICLKRIPNQLSRTNERLSYTNYAYGFITNWKISISTVSTAIRRSTYKSLILTNLITLQVIFREYFYCGHKKVNYYPSIKIIIIFIGIFLSPRQNIKYTVPFYYYCQNIFV